MAKKTKKITKVPYIGDHVTIYGILNLETYKLVKVDLSEKDIWFEYDMSMYTPDKYSVVALKVSFATK